MMKKFLFVCVSLLCAMVGISNAQVRCADKLIDYTPAPGQYVNKSPGLPANAQSIIGGAAESGMMVSLGFFGGSITLGFDEPILNHADNPYGVDFTVFGNPFLGSSEPGIVQVMKDENGNGLADDTWYELRGSDHFLSSTKNDYSITYTNPHETADVPWLDSEGKSGEVVYMKAFHAQEHYPMAANFPHINQDSYTLSGTLLKSKTVLGDIWVNYEFDYGYVDNKTINRGVSLDVPDNPYTLDVVEGCGGDAFDIDWAVDADGNSVALDQIDFIRIYNGVAQNAGIIGEVSTEVCGVAVVKPDATLSGATDVIVSNHPDNTGKSPTERKFKWYKGYIFNFESYVISKGLKNTDQNLIWESDNLTVATVSSAGALSGVAEGEATITCSWQADPAITRSFDIVIAEGVPTTIVHRNELEINVYPNPAQSHCFIKGVNNAQVKIFDITGCLVLQQQNYDSTEALDISSLTNGVYIIQIQQSNVRKSFRIIKR